MFNFSPVAPPSVPVTAAPLSILTEAQNLTKNNTTHLFPQFSAEEETEFSKLMQDYTVKHLKKEFKPFENSYFAIVISDVKKVFQKWLDDMKKEAQEGKHHIVFKVGMDDEIAETLGSLFSYKIGCHLALISTEMVEKKPGFKVPSSKKISNSIDAELLKKTCSTKVKFTWSPTNEFIYSKI